MKIRRFERRDELFNRRAPTVGGGKLILDFQGFKHVNTFFGDQPPYINLLKIYNTAIY